MFSYLVGKLIEWRKEVTGEEFKEDMFNKLSLLRLLFLVVAFDRLDDSDNGLLKIFNNFYAQPYGPVEKDIFKDIQTDGIPGYKIDDNKVVKKDEDVDYSEINGITAKIDIIIVMLKVINNELVTLSSPELIEITQQWSSWNRAFSYAVFSKTLNEKMDTEDIKNEQHPIYARLGNNINRPISRSVIEACY